MTLQMREKRIRHSGSPYYQVKVPAIAAGAFKDFNYDTSELIDARKYAPLDMIEITNNDAVEIEVQLNNKDKFYCPPSSIKTITEHPIHTVRVLNLDGATATTADKIVLLLQKMPLTVDKWVRRFHFGAKP